MLRQRPRLAVLQAAMLEIYNEELRDLLGKGPPPGKKHGIAHDEGGAGRGGGGATTTVTFLEYVDVSQPERVAALLERAMRARSVAATAMNEQSSRRRAGRRPRAALAGG